MCFTLGRGGLADDPVIEAHPVLRDGGTGLRPRAACRARQSTAG
jgi:hypothetical protein